MNPKREKPYTLATGTSGQLTPLVLLEGNNSLKNAFSNQIKKIKEENNHTSKLSKRN